MKLKLMRAHPRMITKISTQDVGPTSNNSYPLISTWQDVTHTHTHTQSSQTLVTGHHEPAGRRTHQPIQPTRKLFNLTLIFNNMLFNL